MSQTNHLKGVSWMPELSPEQTREVVALRRAMREEAAIIRKTREEFGVTQGQAVALRRLRSELGLSQVEAAQILGITQSNVSKMEASRDPKLAVLRQLVEAKGGKLTLHAEFPDRDLVLPL